MAEGAEGQGYGLLRSGLFGGVSCVEDGFAAERLDLATEAAEALFAAGGDYEVCAALGERDGGGPADSGTGSRDEGGFSGEGDEGGVGLHHALGGSPKFGC